MSVGLGTIFGLSSDIVLFVFSAALAVLVIWRDRQNRTTRYFALCMIIFAGHALIHTAWQVARETSFNPKHLLYLSTSLYALGMVMLFNFISTFAKLERRVQIWLIGLSVVVMTGFVILLWRGHVFTNFTPYGRSSYHVSYSSWGMLSVGALLGFIIFCFVMLYAKGTQRARALIRPLLMLVIGIIGSAESATLRDSPFNTLTITIAVMMLGRMILNYRVYQPLADLNTELALKIEELDNAMKHKAQFLANMSHELRTPLNSIIGYAELVVSHTYGDLTELQEDRLKKVARNGHQLLDLINDVLDLSRIEAGRLQLNKTRVQTSELLDNLLDSFQPLAAEKGLKLMRSYGQLPALWADADRTRQIIANLISNAIKYTSHGVIIVRGYYDLRYLRVILSVTDTGPGIKPEYQENLFDMYNRPALPIGRENEGSGLGLALAYQLTRMHDGKLWFETEIGRGTTFHVAFPGYDETIEIHQPILPRTRRSGPVIVAIDDIVESLEVLQGQLETAGYRVYGACTGNDGLMLAHSLKPALITLDIAMPDLDGWQILDTLRGDPVTEAIPVLIISARDDHDPARCALANGFLSKPVQTEVLLRTIEQITGQAPPHRTHDRTPRRRQQEDTV